MTKVRLCLSNEYFHGFKVGLSVKTNGIKFYMRGKKHFSSQNQQNPLVSESTVLDTYLSFTFVTLTVLNYSKTWQL